MTIEQKRWVAQACIGILQKYISLLPMNDKKENELVDYAAHITIKAKNNQHVADMVTDVIAMISKMEDME